MASSLASCKFFKYVFSGAALLVLGFCIALVVLLVKAINIPFHHHPHAHPPYPQPQPYPHLPPYPYPQPDKFDRLPNVRPIDNGDGKVIQYALAYADSAGPYVGVQGTIAVWQPYVEPDDMSLNMVGCQTQNEDIAIYAGYGVFGGDNKSRLFLKTWIFGKECFNDAKCSGFVQVDFTHNLDDILDVSNNEDTSKHTVLPVSIDRDNKEGRWWISFNYIRMGYIREYLLPNMICNTVFWGGMVVTTPNPNLTQMGNGLFPTQGPLKTGEITSAVSITYKKSYNNEQDKKIMVTSPQCFDFQILEGGNHFLYGGSGDFKRNCM